MQNTWRQGLALDNAPDARIWRWGYQHVGILEPTQSLKLPFSPTRNPNASQWNIGGVGSSGVGHVYFMYISCIFHVHFIMQFSVEYGLYTPCAVLHQIKSLKEHWIRVLFHTDPDPGL